MGTNEYNHKGLQITNLTKYCDNLLVRSKSFHLTLKSEVSCLAPSDNKRKILKALYDNKFHKKLLH